MTKTLSNMIKTISRIKMTLFMLVMSFLCGGYVTAGSRVAGSSFTVGFEYNGNIFSIGGMDKILLSDVFWKLGIDKKASEAVMVEFTDKTLLSVTKQDDNWLLSSLKAFTTDEKLTMTFKDGEVLVIKVTDDDLTLPVWLYLPADSEGSPSFTYNTVREAVSKVNNNSKNANSVIELHGDTHETGNSSIIPAYSMTIRSEAGASHTISFDTFTGTANNHAFRVNAAAVTLTIGGGNDYGVLTLDLCSKVGGVFMPNGTLNVQNGVVFTNGNGATGAGGAIRMESSTYNPVVNVYGGSFINNSAATYGGAISVNKGKLNLYGGTFTGNEASTVGNAIYYGQGKEVHISGSPVFSDGQDIYLAYSLTTDATNITALIKDGPITSTIPVSLGNEQTNLFGFRNVLVGGADTVTESDIEHFTIINNDDVSALYLGLGYNANDVTTKAPVLELVTDFINNFDKFIDNDYKPAPSGDIHGKSAKWLDEDKNQAEITIDESSSDGKTVLIIGSLCGAHGLTSDCIKTVINAAAKHNTVEYHFESVTAGAKSQFDQGIAGKHRGPVSGTVEKGKTLSKSTTFETYSGAHMATGAIAKELTKRLQEKQYYEIIMVFDNATITDQCYNALTSEEQKACYKAANMLVPYYNSDKVIWVSSGKKVMYFDYENHKGYSVDNPESLLIKGCYSTDTSLYHCDANHVSSDSATWGKYDKFNTFFTMALMDPATWLECVKENRVPDWSEFTINTEGVLYFNVNDIINYIGNKFFRDEIVINDVVSSGLNIKEAYLESSSDGGVTWTKKTDDVYITIEGQHVSCDIKNIKEDTNIRLKIICDCPGDFKVGQDQPKDTNVGKAVIKYKKDGEEKMSYELDSPQLLKILIDLIIKKSGMKAGESAVFTVTRKGEETPLYTVMITAGNDGSGQVTLKYFACGEYTVHEETSWSWAYTASDPAAGKLTQNIVTNNTFEFKNTPKEDTPPHAEAYKNNKMDKRSN